MNKSSFSLADNIKSFVNPLQKSITLWRFLIIAVTLGVSLIICPRAAFGERNSILILAGIAGLFAVGLLLKFPYLGLIGLASASSVVPFEIGTGSESAINFSALVVGGMAGLMILEGVTRRSQRNFFMSGPILAVIALMIISVLALGSGQLAYFSANPAPIRAQLGGLGIFLLSGFALIEVAFQVHELKWLAWMTGAFLAVAFICVLGTVSQVADFFRLKGANGSVYWIWVLALGISQALINKKLPVIWKALLWVLVAAALLQNMVINRDWLSGWLPGFIAISVILWFYDKKYRIALVGLGLVFVAINSHIITDVFFSTDNQYSLMTRLEAWKILGQIISFNPLLGLGPANYYFYTPLFQILGYAVRFNSHNNYIDIIAQTGILGLGCFLWIGWELGRIGYRLIKTAPEGFAKAYALGAFGGLVATWASGMLGDWVIPFVYNIGLPGFRSSVYGWLFLGGLVALDQILKNKAAPLESK